jgi:hypothetical protein
VSSGVDNYWGGGRVAVSLAKLLQDLITGLKNSAFCPQNGSHSVVTQDILVFCTFVGPTDPRGLRGRYLIDGLRGEASDFNVSLLSKYPG